MRLALVPAAALLLLAGTACGERSEPTGALVQSYPVTVQGTGDATVVEAAPKRIVPVGAGPREILKALGLDRRTTTVDDALVGLPLVDAIRHAKPDLIVAAAETDPLDLARARSATHAPVYVEPGGSVGDVVQAIGDIGLLTGRPVQARRLTARIEAKRQAVAKAVAGTPLVTAFVDTGGFSTISSRTLLGDLIALAHGTSVAGASPEQGPFPVKRLMQLDPGVYLATAGSGRTLAQLRARAGVKRLQARPLRPLRGAARGCDGRRASGRRGARAGRANSAPPVRGGKLAGWLALVGSLAALNYASRFSSGKPPADSLYRYDTALSGLVFYALTLGIVLLIARGLTPAELGLRRPASWPRALGFTLGVLVALLIAESLLENLLHGAREQGLEPAHWNSAKAVQFALNAAVVVLAAPLVEEFTFRGVGFRLLSPFGAVVAVLGTSVAFAADHGLVEGFPALFLFGVAVALVRLRTGSLYPGMLLHASFNAFALAVAVAR